MRRAENLWKREGLRRVLALLCALVLLWPTYLQPTAASEPGSLPEQTPASEETGLPEETGLTEETGLPEETEPGELLGATPEEETTEPEEEEDQDLAYSSADVLSQVVDGTVLLFKWTSINRTSEIPAGEHYVAMVTEQNTTFGGGSAAWTGGSSIECEGTWIPSSLGYNKWSFSSGRSFYTMGSMGSPIMWWDGSSKDGGNGSCPRVAVIYCDENGDPKYAINRNGDQHLTGSKLNNDDGAYTDYARKMVTNTRTKDLSQFAYNANWWSCSYPEHDGKYQCFCLIKNADNARDPGWKIGNSINLFSGNYDINTFFWCERDKDWSDFVYLNLFIGEPTLYSTLTRNYTISDNQTLNLSAETEENAGVYIPKAITLTVSKGGTLSINETCFNDGTIVVDGGTLIIQENGSLCPFATDGKNRIVVKNNGVVIVMKGASDTQGGRLYTSPDYPIQLIQSRLINFGTTVIGGNLTLGSSFVENRKGGNLLIGYEYGHMSEGKVVGNLTGQPGFAAADLSQAGDGVISGVTTDGGNLIVYDTVTHYNSYGVLTNEGSVRGGDYVAGYWYDSDKLEKALEDALERIEENL